MSSTDGLSVVDIVVGGGLLGRPARPSCRTVPLARHRFPCRTKRSRPSWWPPRHPRQQQKSWPRMPTKRRVRAADESPPPHTPVKRPSTPAKPITLKSAKRKRVREVVDKDSLPCPSLPDPSSKQTATKEKQKEIPERRASTFYGKRGHATTATQRRPSFARSARTDEGQDVSFRRRAPAESAVVGQTEVSQDAVQRHRDVAVIEDSNRRKRKRQRRRSQKERKRDRRRRGTCPKYSERSHHPAAFHPTFRTSCLPLPHRKW